MKLYVHPNSQNARRPRMVARLAGQLGTILDEVVLDLAAGEQHRPEFLALNPNHRVPVLVDGDLSLWESGAICQYLSAKAGRTDLWPSDPSEQADVSRWQLWCHSEWGPPIGGVVWQRVMKRALRQGPPDEPLVATHLAAYAEAAALLDAHLAHRAWVAAGRLTLGDISLACTLTYAAPAALPLAPYPHLSAWFDRIRAIEAWRETAPSAYRRP